jgi:metal-responsive CopG/Arc/MetJ family transcriptional regulator
MTKVFKIDDSTIILDMENDVTISFKLDEEKINMIDKLAKEFGYTTRSDFLREAIRQYVEYLKSVYAK